MTESERRLREEEDEAWISAVKDQGIIEWLKDPVYRAEYLEEMRNPRLRFTDEYVYVDSILELTIDVKSSPSSGVEPEISSSKHAIFASSETTNQFTETFVQDAMVLFARGQVLVSSKSAIYKIGKESLSVVERGQPLSSDSYLGESADRIVYMANWIHTMYEEFEGRGYFWDGKRMWSCIGRKE